VSKLRDGGPCSIPGRGRDILLFATASRQALETSHLHIQLVRGDLSPGLKRMGLEAHHPATSTVEVKSAWNYTSTPSQVFMA